MSCQRRYITSEFALATWSGDKLTIVTVYKSKACFEMEALLYNCSCYCPLLPMLYYETSRYPQEGRADYHLTTMDRRCGAKFDARNTRRTPPYKRPTNLSVSNICTEVSHPEYSVLRSNASLLFYALSMSQILELNSKTSGR